MGSILVGCILVLVTTGFFLKMLRMDIARRPILKSVFRKPNIEAPRSQLSSLNSPEMIILPRLLTVTLAVRYYRLDYPSILQDFIWQLDDRTPDFPRVHRFLDYWRQEIRAVISEVNVAAHDGRDWRRIEAAWHL